MAAANGEFSTTIGPDASFKGEATFEKGLRILGKFDGQIKSKGQVHVGEGAKVQADVNAGSVEVDGEVKGNLVATRRIQLSASSKLEGDLQTARLEVADGAVFVGKLQGQPAGQREGGSRSRHQETCTGERRAGRFQEIVIEAFGLPAAGWFSGGASAGGPAFEAGPGATIRAENRR